ncbi:MAG: phosphatase PAP2 family protein [Acidobacteria bacterium]|nr:MAG: phosphatase PAP2 family protein [Acidobacteriota bacterium]
MRRNTESILEPPAEARKGRLRVSELALLAGLTAMTAIALGHPGRVPVMVWSSFVTVGALFAVAALALGEGGQGWRYWARELLPVPLLPYIFLNLGHLIPLVNPHIRDAALLAIDKVLLGPEAQAVLYTLPLPAWLVDVLTLAYSTFYFLGVALLLTLGARRDPFLPRVASAVVITFLVSYAGYFVVPAYGPRTTVAHQRYQSLPGVVGDEVREKLDQWEKTKTDAFPSGHTMVTLAVLFCARRRNRTLYNILLPLGSLLIAATVLLTYHYVIDVLAAVPLTAASLALSAWLAGPIPPVRRDLAHSPPPAAAA